MVSMNSITFGYHRVDGKICAESELGTFQLKDEKSVSRQHLTLTVSNVKRGDGVSVATSEMRQVSFSDNYSLLYIRDPRLALKMKPQNTVQK